MNALQMVFSEKFGEVRTIIINEEVFFFGRDIVTTLGYKTSENVSYTKYIKQYCDEEDIVKMKKAELLELGVNDVGRNGEVLINQYALIDLAVKSRLPQAKPFKHWLIHEAIPSVLETGKYETPKKEQKQQLNTLQQYAMIFFSDDSLADKAVAIQQVEVSQHEEREQKAKEDIFNLVYDKIKDENERKEVKQRIAEYNRTLGIN